MLIGLTGFVLMAVGWFGGDALFAGHVTRDAMFIAGAILFAGGAVEETRTAIAGALGRVEGEIRRQKMGGDQ